MLLAVQLLDIATREEQLPSGSVSLLLLLTDGDPTVGESTAATQGTAQRASLGLHPGLLGDLGKGGNP